MGIQVGFSEFSHSRYLYSQRQCGFLGHWQPSDGRFLSSHWPGKFVFGKWQLLEQSNEKSSSQFLHRLGWLPLRDRKSPMNNLYLPTFLWEYQSMLHSTYIICSVMRTILAKFPQASLFFSEWYPGRIIATYYVLHINNDSFRNIKHNMNKP